LRQRADGKLEFNRTRALLDAALKGVGLVYLTEGHVGIA
jgi:hypothetical protein